MSLHVISKVKRLRAIRDKQRSALERKENKPATVEVLSTQQQLDRFIEFAGQCYIRSGTRLIPFTPLYPYQIELARILTQYRGVIIVKDRQIGVTESITCWMLDRSRSNEAYASCTFSLTERDAYKVSNRVKRMPSQISGFQWEMDSLGVRKPKDGGEMNFRPATANATRGLESIWDLLFDEAGFLATNMISEMYASSTPSQEMVGDAARTAIVSTIPPEGLDCWFFERFEDGLPDEYEVEDLLNLARSGGYLNTTEGAPTEPIPGFIAIADEEGWVHMVVGHKAHPIYGKDPNYVETQRKKKKLTEEQAQREHNLGLPKTGGSLFNFEAIESCSTGAYEPPHPRGYYLAGIDPNMGGEDEWYLQIWRLDIHPFRLVAEWHENYQLPGYCRKKSLDLLDQYNVGLLAIEKNNGGLSQAEELARERPKLRVELVNTSKLSKQINTDRIANTLVDGDVTFPKESALPKQLRKFSRLLREGINYPDDGVMCWAVAFAWLDEALATRPKRSSSHQVGMPLDKVRYRSNGKR